MSSVSIETLMRGYAALAARDEDALMSCLAEDVELQTLTGFLAIHCADREQALKAARSARRTNV
jgi:hypothetical protein